MIIKLHKKEGRTIVAACDDVLLGKIFSDGDTVLDLSAEFYQGDKLSDQEAGDLLRNADVINIVGEQSIRLGINECLIDKKNVLKVSGIPYAQAILSHD